MGCLKRSLTIIYKVKHVSGKAEAIAKLLNEDTGVDNYQIVGHGIAHIDIDCIGQGNGADHRPQPALQSVTTSTDATENTSDGQSDDTHGALNQTIFLWRQS